jgi:hypothetical protein
MKEEPGGSEQRDDQRRLGREEEAAPLQAQTVTGRGQPHSREMADAAPRHDYPMCGGAGDHRTGQTRK